MQVNIELWVAEQRLAQGLPKKITDRGLIAEIERIIQNLDPADQTVADEQVA